MVTHHGGDALVQYLGSFVLYTMLSISFIYGVYWFMRRNIDTPGATPKKAEEANPSLMLEAALPLEENKNLYVIRSGYERFLITISGETTHILSKLDDLPRPVEAVAAEAVPVAAPEAEAVLTTPKPWFFVETPMPPPPPVLSARQRFGQRLAQSIRWLAESRMKSPGQALARRNK
jgi:hypothetical protein